MSIAIRRENPEKESMKTGPRTLATGPPFRAYAADSVGAGRAHRFLTERNPVFSAGEATISAARLANGPPAEYNGKRRLTFPPSVFKDAEEKSGSAYGFSC